MIDLLCLLVLGITKVKNPSIDDIRIAFLDNQQIAITHGCIAALLDNNAT